jgi:hypothetical protein
MPLPLAVLAPPISCRETIDRRFPAGRRYPPFAADGSRLLIRRVHISSPRTESLSLLSILVVSSVACSPSVALRFPVTVSVLP